jgi:hypothetical protein
VVYHKHKLTGLWRSHILKDVQFKLVVFQEHQKRVLQLAGEDNFHPDSDSTIFEVPHNHQTPKSEINETF